jgi:benzoate 4-monooxygenase
MIHYLCKNPAIKSRLVNELEAMLPGKFDGSNAIPFTKLTKLSLLEAAEMECLRLHPPIGYAMPRDTPPGGALICVLYNPGGVAVGVPAAPIGRHPMVYR